MRIRPATLEDAPAIAAIYAHHVLHGTGTFEEEPPTPDAMAERLRAVIARGWPWLVAEEDGDGAIDGYAYAAQFRDRAAYRFTCEDSVYIRPGCTGSGRGRALLDALMAAARDAGFERMIAVIGDSHNHASVRLHEAAGFDHAGRLDAAGFKFGRHVDVVLMQRTL